MQEVRRLSGIGERFYRSARRATTTARAPRNKIGFFSDMYGAGSLRFFDMLEEWRNDGRMEGLELR